MAGSAEVYPDTVREGGKSEAQSAPAQERDTVFWVKNVT